MGIGGEGGRGGGACCGNGTRGPPFAGPGGVIPEP